MAPGGQGKPRPRRSDLRSPRQDPWPPQSRGADRKQATRARGRPLERVVGRLDDHDGRYAALGARLHMRLEVLRGHGEVGRDLAFQ